MAEKSLLDVYKNLGTKEMPTAEEVQETGKWNCSPTIQSALESMGLYECMRDEITKIMAPKTSKYDLSISKAKFDALGKSVGIIAKVVETSVKSGSIDDDDTIDDISFTEIKNESTEEGDLPEDDEISIS